MFCPQEIGSQCHSQVGYAIVQCLQSTPHLHYIELPSASLNNYNRKIIMLLIMLKK